MLRAEELLRALTGEILHLVDILAAAVIALAGVTLGVFVRQDRAHGGDDGGGGDILRSDQLDIPLLAGELLAHQGGDLRIILIDKFDVRLQILIHGVLLFSVIGIKWKEKTDPAGPLPNLHSAAAQIDLNQKCALCPFA